MFDMDSFPSESQYNISREFGLKLHAKATQKRISTNNKNYDLKPCYFIYSPIYRIIYHV